MEIVTARRSILLVCATYLLLVFLACLMSRPFRRGPYLRVASLTVQHAPMPNIPRHIWQTTSSRAPSNTPSDISSNTWRENKHVEYHIYADDDVIAFLRSAGMGDVVDIILKTAAPRVMLADMWRYAILYHRGGFYGDYDTVLHTSIEDWLPREVMSTSSQLPVAATRDYLTTTMDSCDIIIGLENEVHFCQWAMASAPGHPILGRVLELIRARAKDFPRNIPDFVHWHTGPGVWTDAILHVLGIEEGASAADAFRRAWTDDTTRTRARQLRACFLDDTAFNGGIVSHYFSSQWVGDDATKREYSSWTSAANEFLRQNDVELGLSETKVGAHA